MKTLIIYDLKGGIVSMITGFYKVPEGIPYLEVEVPEGKLVTSIDMSVTPNVPIYTDLHTIPSIEQLRADIDYLAMMGGIKL